MTSPLPVNTKSRHQKQSCLCILCSDQRQGVSRTWWANHQVLEHTRRSRLKFVWDTIPLQKSIRTLFFTKVQKIDFLSSIDRKRLLSVRSTDKGSISQDTLCAGRPRALRHLPIHEATRIDKDAQHASRTSWSVEYWSSSRCSGARYDFRISYSQYTQMSIW